MSVALRLEGLSKSYSLAQPKTGNATLRESVQSWIKPNFSWTSLTKRRTSDEIFWALDDVSFDIPQGQIVGIIGRNGAGKSTLLKILSRITPPTKGRALVYGKLQSLLEVGTGFHPDLTGRENIFLNGAILGMPHSEIRRQLDEIVAFAEVERFLDIPVRRYSSGMYIRLAFAVAAHLLSDILLIDEVLAVGDVPFQRKCLSKMGQVAGNGRTVLFVSHQMQAVRQLCTRGILIERGKLVYDGTTTEALKEFHRLIRNQNFDETVNSIHRTGHISGAVRFRGFRVTNTQNHDCYEFQPGDTLRVHFSYQVMQKVPDLYLLLSLHSESSGETLTTLRFPVSQLPLEAGKVGKGFVEIPNHPLLPREYLPYIWLGSSEGKAYDRLNYALTGCPPIQVVPNLREPTQLDGYFQMPGHLVLEPATTA